MQFSVFVSIDLKLLVMTWFKLATSWLKFVTKFVTSWLKFVTTQSNQLCLSSFEYVFPRDLTCKHLYEV